VANFFFLFSLGHFTSADFKLLFVKCSVCGKSFSLLFDILKHELIFHSNNISKPENLPQYVRGMNRMPPDHTRCRVCGIIGEKNHYCINPKPCKQSTFL
jgi:hypothetical protein